ncbi:MAG: DUF4252 domain-containing protein [Pseudomonadales bacterium]|nr:DUF4252 domain-containing protein [Pseudomonadales bacterium]
MKTSAPELKKLQELKKMLPLFFFLLLLVNTSMAADAGTALEDHPGYVDFSGLSLFSPGQSTVEVNLKPVLLGVIASVVNHQEPGLAELLRNLLSVKINAFTTSSRNQDEVLEVIAITADELDQRGWERIAQVRESHDHVDVYYKIAANDNLIQGITMMISKPSSTVFVNIVGEINPDDISTLTQHFDIDRL